MKVLYVQSNSDVRDAFSLSHAQINGEDCDGEGDDDDDDDDIDDYYNDAKVQANA
jgi:hypothetical protein